MSVRRGTILFEAGDKAHALRLGTNQLAEAEDAFGKPINAIVQEMQGDNVRVSDLRRFFAIAGGMTESEAGDVMDEIGIAKAGELLGQAMTAAFPADEAAAGKSGNGASRKRT